MTEGGVIQVHGRKKASLGAGEVIRENVEGNQQEKKKNGVVQSGFVFVIMAQFAWTMGSSPDNRSRKDTDRNGFGFDGHYSWMRCVEDPAAVCEHPGHNKSECRAGVGELGEEEEATTPHLPEPDPAMWVCSKGQ